jgi:predicted metalloendopeptidase
LYENFMAAQERQFADVIDLIGGPVDRSRWILSIFSPMAAYHPQWNQVTIPLAFLQPPRIGSTLPAELKFAGLGMIVGHEIAHAFDQRGRRFDREGGLQALSPSTEEQFKQRDECLSSHFSKFEHSPKFYSRFSASTKQATFVDPVRTKDENFADVVGLSLAYRAYTAHRAEGAAARELAGFSGDRLFFLAFAQNWCGRSNPFIERYVETERQHAPNHARVNGTLALAPEFARAFGCAQGSPMRAERTCELF